MSEEFNPQTSDTQTFLCPQCGAEMGWDADHKMLHCEYCNYQ